MHEARARLFNNRRRQERVSAAEVTKTDQQLIDEALEAGRVTKCDPGEADGALHWHIADKVRVEF